MPVRSQRDRDMSSGNLYWRGNLEMLLIGWTYAKGFMKLFLVIFNFFEFIFITCIRYSFFYYMCVEVV